MLQRQLEVMNKAYTPHGFSFKLVNTTRTINARWATGADELEMKYSLRKGTYASLNVYFLERLADGSTGVRNNARLFTQNLLKRI